MSAVRGLCCALLYLSLIGCIEEAPHALDDDPRVDAARLMDAHLPLDLGIPADAWPVVDARPALPDGALPQGDPIEPLPPIECALSREACFTVRPGCWGSEPCEEPACPLGTCDARGPVLEALSIGHDLCGGAWIIPWDAEGRYSAGPIEGPWGAGGFDLGLDGRVIARCDLAPLPTGMERYHLRCEGLDGALLLQAIVEDEQSEACQACPDLSGCYFVESEICVLMLPCSMADGPVALSSEGCQVRVETSDGEAWVAWSSQRGALTMRGEGALDGACSFLLDAQGQPSSVICTGGEGDAESDAFDINLIPAPPEACAFE